MSYTPVSQRKNTDKPKSSYTPVSQRKEAKTYNELFPALQSVQRATFELNQETGIDRIKDRSFAEKSRDTIFAGEPEKESILRRILGTTKLGRSFEENILDPFTGAASKLFPSTNDRFADYVRRNPNLSAEEARQGFLMEEGSMGGMVIGDTTVDVEATGGLTTGRAGLGRFGGQIIKNLVEATTEEAAQRVGRNLGTTDPAVMRQILGIKTEEEAFDFLSRSAARDAGDDIVTENLLNKTAIDFADADDAARALQLQETLRRRALNQEELAEAKSLVERVDGELPQSGLFQAAVDNLRNPATRQGGFAGRVPEGMSRQPREVNQFVSSADSTTAKATRPVRRVDISAGLDEIEQAIAKRDVTVEKIGELETRLSIAEEALNTDAASQLVKYVSRSTGRLPEVTGKKEMLSTTGSGKTVKNSTFGRKGDGIVTELGFDSVDDAQRALDSYTEARTRVTELRDLMRDQKTSRALANKVTKVTRAAGKGRRNLVDELQEQFGLSNRDIQKLSNRQDYRTMSDNQFNRFIERLNTRAVELADTRQAKAELMHLMEIREFQKVDNLRRAKQLPPISQMNADQLRQYAETLENFQEGDVFLTQRQLEVVDRTSLKGIKTLREAKERLLAELKKDPKNKDLTLENLSNVTSGASDLITYDSALREKNPFFQTVVERTHTHMMEAELSFLEVLNKVDDLATKAAKSRNRGIVGSVRQALIPKHDEIIKYLEAPVDQKRAFAKALTKEELDYANYVSQYYSQAYDHLVKINELKGSRYVDEYFTHTRRGFLEAWSDDGLIKATKEMWSSHKEDQMVAQILDDRTGQILPKSKFFQFTLQRTGELTPSKNLTRVFLQYAKMFERKKMFDRMIPELDIYVEALAPKNLTPKGLETDASLKQFINKYLNNKKGRRESFGGLIKQNGPADMGLRMVNSLVSLLDLGVSFTAQTAATIGEQMATYQSLGKRKYTKAWKRRLWDTGIKRLGDKNSKAILKQAEPFIGRNIWTELAEADKGFGDRLMQGIFGGFAQATVESNKLFLLGNLTKAEMKAGKISPERMAQLRLDAGRWRDMGSDVKSIYGSTSVGQAVTKYKGWAIPILRTNLDNIEKLSKRVATGDMKALKSREAAELYRAVEMTAVIAIVGSSILSEEDEDTFLGRLKARAYMEAMTISGGIDPTLFIATPRALSFIQQFAENLKKIVTLEEYESDSRWGEKGDLKGVKGLQRQFTPSAIRQLQNPPQTAPRSNAGATGGSELELNLEDLELNLDDLELNLEDLELTR